MSQSTAYSITNPVIARTLLQAGLWAATGKSFPICGNGLSQIHRKEFRKALVERSLREKMVPMLATFLRAHESGPSGLPDELSEIFGIISNEHYSHLNPVLGALRELGIPVVLIKGADLDLAVYKRKFPRVMADIDILVRPPDVHAAIDVFRAHGFVQGTFNKALLEITPLSDQERREAESGSIELAEFIKLVPVPALAAFQETIRHHLSPYWRVVSLHDSVYLVVSYDIHLHLSLDFDASDVWHKLRPVDCPELGQCLGQSFTDISWYLATRFYHELHVNSASVMRSFIDVALVTISHAQSIDWNRIELIADKYKLRPSLFYVFWHIGELVPGIVPASFLDFVNPATQSNDRGHDWGDFVPRMLGEVQLSAMLHGGFDDGDGK